MSLEAGLFRSASTAPTSSTGCLVLNDCPGWPLVWHRRSCYCQLREIIPITLSITLCSLSWFWHQGFRGHSVLFTAFSLWKTGAK